MEKAMFESVPGKPRVDKIEVTLKAISEYITSIVFGFLPILFIPIAFVPLDYGKIVLVIAALALAIVFFSLSILRSGSLRVTAPPAMIALWGLAGIASLSAVFSGDTTDAFIGDFFEVNTALFLIILALVGSLTSLVQFTKASIMRLYIFLTGSACILGLFHVSRLVFGPEFLSLGLFTSNISSTVGSWNDLGLFFGLSILLSLVALEQLPLTKWGRIIFTVGIVLSLVMLGAINFIAVWWVLGLISLVMLMYSLIKDRFSDTSLNVGEQGRSSIQSILISLGVFIVSLVFIIAGGALGGVISKATGISYLEVRPSFTATTNIARAVYAENAFFGVGPNKFVDAWRMHKDPAINQTIFWETDFRGGNGYITTSLVTTGILGFASWIVFLGLFVYAGFRMLFKTVHADRFWYFIGSSSFVAATYLWGMSFVYLSGASILLLAALFTSIMFAAYVEMVGAPTLILSIQKNKRAAILLVGVVMVVVVASASSVYFTGKHFSSIYTYGKALNSVSPGTTLQSVEQGIANAFSIKPNDVFARRLATYQLAKINSLLTLNDPTPAQIEEFKLSMQNAGVSAAKAVELDKTDALNWAVLGSVYSIAVAAGETEALPKAEEAFANAKQFSPQNPSFALLEAQLQARAQNVDRSRELINESIALKSNYTEALNFLAQLEVALGRTDEAIAATQSIINLEPNNPARYYQLGILLSVKDDSDGSAAAFKQAINLDTNYANARYLLALVYAKQNKLPEAIEQLEVVLKLNPDNATVKTVIDEIKSGRFIAAPEAPNQSVSEPETVVEGEANVTTSEVPDTPLVSPVNNAPESEETPETSTN